MAAPIEEILWTGKKPCIIEKLKVKNGSHIAVGSLLITCKILDEKGATEPSKSTRIERLKSSLVGTVQYLYVKVGQTVQPGGLVMTVTPCDHPTVMKDMCADCGADLRVAQGRPGERMQYAAASVAMVHNIPELHVSKEVALELAQQDVKSLLRNRKLVLIVDLDQTIIHTTMKNVPKSLPSVHHFQLMGSGKQYPWYHTKLRPGCRELLEKLTEKFQLHIFTMGSRPYAHTVARILDPDKKLFADRILSRDECFDQNSKTANLSSIFPTGDHMVCIIDDREDVWNFAPNLIHVKPYQYFVDTEDINMPPGVIPPDSPLTLISSDMSGILNKTERSVEMTVTDRNDLKDKTIKEDIKQVTDPTDKKGRGKIVLDSDSSTDKDPTSPEASTESNKRRKVDVAPSPGDNDGSTPEGNDVVTNVGTITSTADQVADRAGEATEGISVGSDSGNDRGTEDIADENGDRGDGKQGASETIIPTEEDTREAGDDEKIISRMEQGRSDGLTGGDSTTGGNSAPTKEETNSGMQEKDKVKTSSDDSREESTNETKKEKEPGCSANQETTAGEPGEDKTGGNQADSTRKAREPVLSSPKKEEDCTDDYLLYLEDILFRVHEKFFKIFDHFVIKKKDAIPDVKVIIPSIRKKVLAGVRITFSSVFPRNLPPERYRLWNVAISLGAQVSKEFVPNDNGENKSSWTTHVVAAKTGTSKVNSAKKSRKVQVVTPLWLVACWERWERVDERLYLLSKMSGIQIASGRSTPASENEQIAAKSSVGTKKQVTVPEQTKTKREESKNNVKADADDSEQLPLSLCEDYNPLYSFSSQDIKAMDKEVEDIFGESSSSGESDPEETSIHSPSAQSLGSITQELPSSSDESLTADSPRGWKRKREDTSSESGDDGKEREEDDGDSKQPSDEDWLSDEERDEMACAIDDLLSYSTTARSISTHLTMPKL